MQISCLKLIKTCAGCFVTFTVIVLAAFVFTSSSSSKPRHPLFITGWSDVHVDPAYSIKNYNVKIDLQDDGSFDVEETIDTDFVLSKHGIYRYIPIYFERKLADGSFTDSSLDISSLKVWQNDQPAVVENSTQYYTDLTFSNLIYGATARVKFLLIGDSYKTVNGPITYRISYHVKNGLSEDGNGNYQLYWNGTGNGWGVDNEHTTIDVRTHGIKIYKDAECFAGPKGSTTGACVIKTDTQNHVGATAVNLKPGEGLTILANLDKSDLPMYRSNVGGGIKEYFNFAINNWFLGLPAISFVAMFLVWLLYGRSPRTRGIIAPRYDAPNNLTPAQAGVIIDESADNIDLSATIINFAVKGLMKIEDLGGGDYSFKKTEPRVPYELSVEDKIIYNKIFSAGDTIMLSSLKYNFYDAVQQAQIGIYNWGKYNGYFMRTPGLFGLPLFLAYATWIIPVAGILITRSIPLLLVSLFFVIPSGFLVAIFNNFTKKGKELQEELLGLKMYISTAEKDRINYLNAPARTPELFERLLPYAMVLGVVDIWADQFKNIYTQPPEWYQGDWNNFNTYYFVNSIHHASSNFTSTMTSTPPSTSGGGGSFGGFGGGGGFSGGGGGGGGGGSW